MEYDEVVVRSGSSSKWSSMTDENNIDSLGNVSTLSQLSMQHTLE